MNKKKSEEKKDEGKVKVSNMYIRKVSLQDQTGRYVDPSVMRIRTSVKFPFKFQYWMTRIFDFIGRESKIVEKSRGKLLDEYVVKDDKGNMITKGAEYLIKDGKKGEFDEKFEKLLEIEVTLPVDKIEVDWDDKELDKKFSELTEAEMSILLPIIK